MKPKLRFKGFDGEWEKHYLNELGAIKMCKRILKYQTSSQGEVPFFKIGTFGGIPDAFISFQLFDEYRNKYSFPKKGDVLISAAGTIGRSVVYDGKPAYYQDSNIIWIDNNNKIILNELLSVILPSIKWAVASTTIPRIYNDTVKKTSAIVPQELSEQKKLTKIFQSIDEQITTAEARIEGLRKVKAASLQAMFPQEGETKPRLRFKGFEDDWKKDIVKNICDTSNGKSNTQDQIENGSYPFFIRSEKIVKSNRYLYDCEAVITVGDGQIGKIFHYVNGKFDLHQRCYYMSNFREIDGKFFYYFFSNSFYDRVIRMSAKATVDSVRLEMITNMPITYPVDNREQQKIADYFSNLDRQITLEEQRLEKLRQIKAACLDNMFV